MFASPFQLPSLCASLWFCFELLSLFSHVFLKSVGWSKELGFCSLPSMFLFNWKVKPVPVACPKTVTSCSFLVSQWWIQLKLRLSLSFLLAHRFARQFFSFFSSISISCSSVHVQLVWNSYLCVCVRVGAHMCVSMCPFKGSCCCLWRALDMVDLDLVMIFVTCLLCSWGCCLCFHLAAFSCKREVYGTNASWGEYVLVMELWCCSGSSSRL